MSVRVEKHGERNESVVECTLVYTVRAAAVGLPSMFYSNCILFTHETTDGHCALLGDVIPAAAAYCVHFTFCTNQGIFTVPMGVGGLSPILFGSRVMGRNRPFGDS